KAIQSALLSGYASTNPETGFPTFAFRLHQFISKGDTVHSSLESEASRYITTEKQKFVPENREKILLPVAFCRECGQEYYSVRRIHDAKAGKRYFEPRDLNDLVTEDDSEAGFLYINSKNPWPDETAPDFYERLPDDWIEERNGSLQVRK